MIIVELSNDIEHVKQTLVSDVGYDNVIANGRMSANSKHCTDGTRTFLTYVLIGISINVLVSFIRTVNTMNLNNTNIPIITLGVTCSFFSNI